MERITSRTNPLCTHFRKLASSKAYREDESCCHNLLVIKFPFIEFLVFELKVFYFITSR